MLCLRAAWAGRDLDAIMAMHADDTVFHLHGGGEPAIGRGATREAFAATLAAWPDMRFDRKRVHIGAEHFVSEYEMSATTVDGQLLVCDGVDVFAVVHGRVARKLVRLQLEGTETPMRDAKVFDGEREVGFITSAAQSPRLGTIALGYLHRDFVEAGTAVDVQAGDTRVRAHVSPPSAS